MTISLFWRVFVVFVNSWRCRFFGCHPIYLLPHQAFKASSRSLGASSFSSGFGCLHRNTLTLLSPSYLSLSSHLNFANCLPARLAGIGSFRNGFARSLSAASRLRLSIAGIAVLAYRSMGASAYGLALFRVLPQASLPVPLSLARAAPL
jgi:hypothetical protein